MFSWYFSIFPNLTVTNIEHIFFCKRIQV
ncbi:MAG: hypothetical protein KDD23_09945 [Winogradskyella sp.]|nr:hypothetical protein [Winogradskyella sp.]